MNSNPAFRPPVRYFSSLTQPFWWSYPPAASDPEPVPVLPEQGPCLDHYLVICRRPDGSMYPLEMSTSLEDLIEIFHNAEGIWRVCHIEGDRMWNESAKAARLWLARHPPGSIPMPPFVQGNIK